MTRHNGLVRFVLALVLSVPLCASAEIYKWTDENGKVHYSNRAGDAGGQQASPPRGRAEGWESVVERQQGADEISKRADRIINSLSLDLRKKKRERERAWKALEEIRRKIEVAQTSDRAALPALISEDRQQILEVQRVDGEIAAIEAGLAKVRAAKQMGREQAREAGDDPHFQFGQ